MTQKKKGSTKGKPVGAIVVVIVVFAILAVAAWYALQPAPNPPSNDPSSQYLNGRTPPPNAQSWRDLYNQLTPDQRIQLRDKMMELRSQGASQEEISDAMNELLRGWGYDVP